MPIMLAFAFIAIALITPALIYGIQQNNQMMIGLVAARQMRDVTHAAKGYITTYAAAIEGTATATAPVTITVPMLVNTGFLPAGFGQTNPYQQTWEVQVLQPSPGDLQALVLSQGGVPIQPAETPRIGAEEGGSGGSVQANGTAQGSFGSWQVSLADYTNPGVGHVASLIDYSNGQLQSDYLYRTAVPGEPQLNTMQTNLDMGTNNITNAQNVSANGTLGTGTNGSLNAYLNSGGVVYAGDQMELGTANGAANVGWGCSPNGAIAADANGSGALMICEGGSWQPSNTATTQLVYNNDLWDSYGAWYWQGVTWANICTLGEESGGPSGGFHYLEPVAGPNAQGQYYWEFLGHDWNGYSQGSQVMCWDMS